MTKFTKKVLRVTTVLAVISAFSAIAGDKPRRERELRPPHQTTHRSLESGRDDALERARSEIRKNPNQKKFILFRYGLDEEDLGTLRPK